MSMPIDLSHSGPKARYDPLPIETLRNEVRWSPRTNDVDSSVVIHSVINKDSVYGQDVEMKPTLWERFEDWMQKCSCGKLPGFVVLLLFLVFLGVVITAAVLIFIFAIPGTQTLPLISAGDTIDLFQRNITWPEHGELQDDTFAKLQPSRFQSCVGFGFSCTTRPDQVVGTHKRCDGVNDCGDSSDETFCKVCSTNHWCSSEDGKKTCLTPSMICDGVKHCPDGSDETNFCKATCNETQFTCSKKMPSGLQKCLPKEYQCDGYDDCPGGEDEQDCKKCNQGSEYCKADRKCIPKGKVCDGHKNCSDGSDEKGCDCVMCSGTGKVLCNDGTCILSEQVCDGTSDCAKGVDEMGCPAKRLLN